MYPNKWLQISSNLWVFTSQQQKKGKIHPTEANSDSSCGVIEVHRLELKFLNALQLLKILKGATCCWHIHLLTDLMDYGLLVFNGFLGRGMTSKNLPKRPDSIKMFERLLVN